MQRWVWVGVACALACGDDDAGTDAGADAMVDAAFDAATDAALDATEDAGERDARVVDPGLLEIDDLSYLGAFRFSSAMFGGSETSYAVGTLGCNADRRSLFIAGHAQHSMIAEFAIPDALGTGDVVADLPIVESPLQDFYPVLGESPNGNPDEIDRITGLYWSDGQLIINANRWYDAAGTARDTTLVVRDALGGTVDGYFELEGAARSAGYMSPIPAEWQDALGGDTITGWASNYSIVSRYSVGPTLYVFDPTDVTGSAAGAQGAVSATAFMDFDYGGGEEGYLAPDALVYTCSQEDEGSPTICEDGASASPLWNVLSRAMYGFVVPGTRTFALFGSSAGVDTGIGYKITQTDDNLCGGPCARGADDQYNYYWFFDLDEILAASALSDPRPYAYGRWSVPFDRDGAHSIIGGAYAPDENVLYLSLEGAAKVGDFDWPPLIVAFQPTP